MSEVLDQAIDPLPVLTGMAAAGAPEAPVLPDSILQIPVNVQVVLGSARMAIGKVADLKAGSIVMLDQKLGTPVTILVNGKEVAKGELFVLDGEMDRLGVTITELAAHSAGS
jgi:flagellar motor switch protein FliN/FliY